MAKQRLRHVVLYRDFLRTGDPPRALPEKLGPHKGITTHKDP